MTDVYVDPGHSARDGGAAAGGRSEHPEALEVARAVDARLAELGISRSIDLSGNDPGVHGSVKAANASGAKRALEIHFDWSGGIDAVFGLHVSDAGARFARSLVDALEAAGFDRWKDGVIHEDEIGRSGLAFLNNTRAPAVILELGRIQDYPAAVNRRQGIAIAEGIAAELGVGVPEPEPDDEPDGIEDLGGPFRDVRPGTPLAEALEVLKAEDLIVGYPDGTFRGGEPATRTAIALVAKRLLDRLG